MIDGELDALVAAAVAAHEDSDERWELVRALQARGDRATFDALAASLVDDDPAARTVAADVLGQFGDSGAPGVVGEPSDVTPAARPFNDEAVELINARLRDEVDPDALQSAIAAAGHLGDARAIPLLRARAGHGQPFVRWSLVIALGGFDDDDAVEAVVEFLGDPSPMVRDWAAFAFGVTRKDRDSPEIRAALLPLLRDEDPIARSEAMRALALRGVATEDVVQALLATLPLRDELENYEPLDDAVLLVAAETGDPRLRDAVLTQLREWDELSEGCEPIEELPDLLLAAASAYAGS